MKKLVLFIAMGLYSSLSFAGSAIYGATEPTQILNNIELVQQSIDIYKQLQTAKDQLQTMLTDLKKLGSFTDNGQDLVNILSNLNKVIQQGQALAYSADNLSSEFTKRYKDFDKYFAEQINKNGKVDINSAKNRYQNWSRENLDSVHSALRAANLQSKYFQNDAETIKEIERKSRTAQGRDQILQAGVEIAANTAKQMVELRQLISSDMQLQANYQASLIDRQAEKDAWKLKAMQPYDAKDHNPKSFNQIVIPKYK